jgi:thioredoxin-dependent peroxiredoxin
MWVVIFAMLLVTAIFAAVRQQPPASQTGTLKVGDAAPDFTLPDQDGKPVHLSGFKGKQKVVLAFYIKAFTSGWTREVQGYRDSMASFRQSNAQVLGISVDSVADQKEFAKQTGADFPLLSDPKGEVAIPYGVWNKERSFANRATFVIDEQGKIVQIELGSSAIDVNGALSACSKKHWEARSQEPQSKSNGGDEF